MPALQEISETLIRDQIVRAVADVFKTMLSARVELKPDGFNQPCWPPLSPVPEAAATHIVGSVGFIGDINGVVYLYFDETFASQCTANLLGMSAAELTEAGSEPVNDAVGELSNMIVGGFKNGLCDAGYPCKLTIPSILRGRHFCVDPIKPAHRYIYAFEYQGHRLVADIFMKFEE